MWNRSRWILGLLLFIYVPQVILSLVVVGVYNNGKYLSGTSQLCFTGHSNLTQVAVQLLQPCSPVTIGQIINFSFCNVSWSSAAFVADVYDAIPRFVLGAMLLILAVTQTLKQSVHMYKTTKKWQLNRYMEQLVRDGIIYFLVYVSEFLPPPLGSICHCHSFPPILSSSIRKQTNHSIVFFRTARNMFYNIATLVESKATGATTLVIVLAMLCSISMCPMMPRFIISVRVLYDRELRRGVQGVDTGFGVLSQTNTNQNGPLSAIAFADIAPQAGLEQDQIMEVDANESAAIRLEPIRDNTHQV